MSPGHLSVKDRVIQGSVRTLYLMKNSSECGSYSRKAINYGRRDLRFIGREYSLELSRLLRRAQPVLCVQISRALRIFPIALKGCNHESGGP